MPQGYANPGLLVETGWLAEHLGDPNLRLVDSGVRTGEPPRAERIPGAVSPPHHYIKSAENPRFVAGPDEAKAIFEALGVGDNTLVVAYDSARSVNAARLWWVLRYYGHHNVRVLNGGFDKWAAEGRPVTTDAPAAVPPASFTPAVNDAVLSTADSLMAAVDDPSAAIWDTRSEAEFTGENDRGNARVGHVPGAAFLEWSDVMAEDGTFAPAECMRVALERIGVTPDKTVHTY